MLSAHSYWTISSRQYPHFTHRQAAWIVIQLSVSASELVFRAIFSRVSMISWVLRNFVWNFISILTYLLPCSRCAYVYLYFIIACEKENILSFMQQVFFVTKITKLTSINFHRVSSIRFHLNARHLHTSLYFNPENRTQYSDINLTFLFALNRRKAFFGRNHKYPSDKIIAWM